MQTLMAAVVLMSTAMIGGAVWLVWLDASGGDTKQGTLALLLFSVLSTPVVLVIFLPRLQAELDRQIAASRNDPPPRDAAVTRTARAGSSTEQHNRVPMNAVHPGAP